MRRWKLVGLLLLAALSGQIRLGFTGEPAETSGSPECRIDLLVKQLGNDSYLARQRASKSLGQMGIAVQPALEEALEDEDAEIRLRAAQVLSEVLEADFQQRLEAFAADPDGKRQHLLPSWNLFRKMYGEDRTSRNVFVEMQRAEPGLLEALEANGKLTSELFVARSQAILQAIQWPNVFGVEPNVSLGTVATLLFVSSAEGVTVNEQDALQLYNMIHQRSFQENMRSGPRTPLLKRMLGLWIVQNSDASIAHQNLMLAFNFELKEGLNLATKMIGHDAGQPYVRQYIVLAIGRFGSRENMHLLEPLLKDSTACMPQQGSDPRHSQVRDVALAVMVHLSGQQLKDYGFAQVQTNPQMLFQPGTVTFPDQAKRDAALKLWANWSAEHPDGK